MAEKQYVEKQDALNAICKACDRQHPDDKENCPQEFAGCMEFYNVFELPAADVEPVRHGRWILDDETGVPICSECHSGKPTKCVCSSVIDHKLSNYEIRRCYFCGAKMDGGEENG